MTAPKDTGLIKVLVKRDGEPTLAVLKDGRELKIWNIAWGYDLGEAYAHVTTNISPNIDGQTVDVFETHEVVALLHPETRHSLITLPA